MELDVVPGDLLDQPVEVIVNAWNRNFIPRLLLRTAGVSKAIRCRAGSKPFDELARCGILPVGGAVATSAGELPFKAIIHVAGINALWRATERSIRDSVRNAVRLASQLGYGSLAMPLIGAGTGGRSPDWVLATMLDELSTIDFDGRVLVVQYSHDTRI